MGKRGKSYGVRDRGKRRPLGEISNYLFFREGKIFYSILTTANGFFPKTKEWTGKAELWNQYYFLILNMYV